jgi:hypothetical protein
LNKKSLEKAIQNNMYAGTAISLALVLSIQRYFPAQMSQISTNKLLIELGIISAVFYVSTYYTL